MNKYFGLTLILSMLGLASCESTTSPSSPSLSTNGGRVFILDEGLYTHNNASLDVYNWKDSALATDLVDPLGDVGNDIELINGRLYVVLDNSSKIVVINPDSIADRLTINFSACQTPGKIMQISQTEALVADLYDTKMYVLNLTTHSVSSSFDVGGGQDWLARLGGKVFAVTGSNSIVSVDPTSKSVTKSAYIGVNPMQVEADSTHNSLLVLTYGNYSPRTSGKLLWVDPATLAVTDSVVLDTNRIYNQVVMAGSSAYVLTDTGVMRLDLASHKFGNAPAIAKSYYGGHYDAVEGLVYLGTEKDFLNPDVVDIYEERTTTLVKTLHVGIAPAFFAIVR